MGSVWEPDFVDPQARHLYEVHFLAFLAGEQPTLDQQLQWIGAMGSGQAEVNMAVRNPPPAPDPAVAPNGGGSGGGGGGGGSPEAAAAAAPGETSVQLGKRLHTRSTEGTELALRSSAAVRGSKPAPKRRGFWLLGWGGEAAEAAKPAPPHEPEQQRAETQQQQQQQQKPGILGRLTGLWQPAAQAVDPERRAEAAVRPELEKGGEASGADSNAAEAGGSHGRARATTSAQRQSQQASGGGTSGSGRGGAAAAAGRSRRRAGRPAADMEPASSGSGGAASTGGARPGAADAAAAAPQDRSPLGQAAGTRGTHTAAAAVPPTQDTPGAGPDGAASDTPQQEQQAPSRPESRADEEQQGPSRPESRAGGERRQASLPHNDEQRQSDLPTVLSNLQTLLGGDALRAEDACSAAAAAVASGSIAEAAHEEVAGCLLQLYHAAGQGTKAECGRQLVQQAEVLAGLSLPLLLLISALAAEMLSSNGPGPSAPDGLLGMLVGELRRAAGSISFDEQPCLEDASLVLGAFAPLIPHLHQIEELTAAATCATFLVDTLEGEAVVRALVQAATKPPSKALEAPATTAAAHVLTHLLEAGLELDDAPTRGHAQTATNHVLSVACSLLDQQGSQMDAVEPLCFSAFSLQSAVLQGAAPSWQAEAAAAVPAAAQLAAAAVSFARIATHQRSVERAVREQALEVLAQLLQHTPSAAADIGGEGLAGRVLLEAGHAARGSGLHLSLYTQVTLLTACLAGLLPATEQQQADAAAATQDVLGPLVRECLEAAAADVAPHVEICLSAAEWIATNGTSAEAFDVECSATEADEFTVQLLLVDVQDGSVHLALCSKAGHMHLFCLPSTELAGAGVARQDDSLVLGFTAGSWRCGAVRFSTLLGIDASAALDVALTWKTRGERKQLRAALSRCPNPFASRIRQALQGGRPRRLPRGGARNAATAQEDVAQPEAPGTDANDDIADLPPPAPLPEAPQSPQPPQPPAVQPPQVPAQEQVVKLKLFPGQDPATGKERVLEDVAAQRKSSVCKPCLGSGDAAVKQAGFVAEQHGKNQQAINKTFKNFTGGAAYDNGSLESGMTAQCRLTLAGHVLGTLNQIQETGRTPDLTGQDAMYVKLPGTSPSAPDYAAAGSVFRRRSTVSFMLNYGARWQPTQGTGPRLLDEGFVAKLKASTYGRSIEDWEARASESDRATAGMTQSASQRDKAWCYDPRHRVARNDFLTSTAPGSRLHTAAAQLDDAGMRKLLCAKHPVPLSEALPVLRGALRALAGLEVQVGIGVDPTTANFPWAVLSDEVLERIATRLEAAVRRSVAGTPSAEDG